MLEVPTQTLYFKIFSKIIINALYQITYRLSPYILELTIPTIIDELKSYGKGWIFVKAKIKYTPISEVFRIKTNVEYLAAKYHRAVFMYATREVEIVFRVYVKFC